VEHIFFENSLGVVLACFNNTQVLPKNAVNPKSRRNQKNRCSSGKLALTNLKRSGFVFIRNDLKFKNIEHKTKCRCFFDVGGFVQKAHCWIDKALWVLWRSKVPCTAAESGKLTLL
jgi:hypothetical protein